MESPLLILITLSFFFQSLLVSSQTLSNSSTICKTTPDPKYCKSVFPHSQGNVQQYGRFSIRKSLSQSRKFIRTIDRYIKRNAHLSAHLSQPAVIRALQDCRFLAGLTMDYLLTSFETVNDTSANSSFKTLSFPKADDIQTLLSAALTNEQTCLEGLTTAASSSATWTVRNGVALPLVNDTKLLGVSLALFTKGWVPKKKKRAGFAWAQPRSGSSTHTKPFRLFRNGALPLKMTEKTKAVYESLSRRKLSEGDGNGDGDDGSMVLISDIVTVSQDGTGNFTNITAAVAAAPNNTDGSAGFFLIYVTAGIYEEYISIAKNKRYLMMIGDGINQTVVTGNRSVVDGWTTFNSATFAVTAPNFVAVNITFRNTAGPEKHQAVALRSGADFSIFYSCSFEAYQDTLYTHTLRQFYRECDVYGTVDFIFGNAAVVFQNCNLYPRKPMPNQFNAITAQGRSDPNQNTGTSIQNCTIKPADDLVSSNYTVKTYLGRPWKEYSRTVYMQSYIDGFVEPVGWREWNVDFALSTLYYAEYNNTGPGSNTTNRVAWPGYHVINSTDAANFTVTGLFIKDDWIWNTGVPYTSGLIS
ncbi:Pectinesterase inhibitor domain [Arabidopsis suecica]|uniref:Pectinesterase n=1 Tax=Arabidopsis suecica TaxID=45249 RepID=A0A8T2C7V0_ARASU|nr:Pectinesterase inhibitor domain [Arabidopsis suecica]